MTKFEWRIKLQYREVAMTTIPQPTSPVSTTPSASQNVPPQSFVPAPPEPYRQGFNLRLWIFILAISAPFLWIIGSAVIQSMTGGISDHGDYKEVDLKQLGNFTFDDLSGKVQDVPERYRNLDGQRVLLKGYMAYPEDAKSRGRRFQFVYNVTKCCFSGPPLVQERVFAKAKSDIPIYDTNTFAEVVGTLHVRLIKEPVSGKIVSVYDLDVESAKRLDG